MVSLTWRASRDGSTEAAYLGACRVGYVTIGGLWWTSLLRPEGGVAAGRCPGDPAAARTALEASVASWVASAGLSAAPLGAVDGAASPTVDETGTVPSTVKKGPIRSKRVL